jgi:hypothetical protein
MYLGNRVGNELSRLFQLTQLVIVKLCYRRSRESYRTNCTVGDVKCTFPIANVILRRLPVHLLTQATTYRSYQK